MEISAIARSASITSNVLTEASPDRQTRKCSVTSTCSKVAHSSANGARKTVTLDEHATENHEG